MVRCLALSNALKIDLASLIFSVSLEQIKLAMGVELIETIKISNQD